MLNAGLKHTITIKVGEEHTAAHLGSGDIKVLGTPYMIALMERTSRLCVADVLEKGQTTVGTVVNIRHVAATPVGMEVVSTAELTDVDGRRLTFKVEVHDEKGLVGDGVHERFIIDSLKFMSKANAKVNA